VKFILGFFGKKVPVAQKRYREFVEEKIGQEERSPLKEVVFSTKGGIHFTGVVFKDQKLIVVPGPFLYKLLV
jgi:hypothetical protein